MTGTSMRRWPGIALALIALIAGGCATSGAIVQARGDFRAGDPDAALAVLATGRIAERDRLVALMEGGFIAHASGRIHDSIRLLRDAARLVDELDAVFVGEQGGALLVSDRATRYRGEYAERLWIRTVQMLNHLVLGDWEGASVEARQAIEVFDRYAEALQADVFTRTLLARVLHAVGEPGAAAIEYALAFEQSGGQVGVAALARSAAREAGRPDDVVRYDKALERDARGVARQVQARTGDGSLLLIVASGQVPRKRAGNLFIAPDARISFPYYPNFPDMAIIDGIRLVLDGEPLPIDPIGTRLGQVAEASLAARARQVVTRQTLRVVAKQGLGVAASREDPALGLLVNALFFLLEEADTRSWRTLPGQWTLIERALPTGRHRLEVSAGSSGRRVVIEDLRIDAGATSVLVLADGPEGLQRITPRAAPAPAATRVSEVSP